MIDLLLAVLFQVAAGTPDVPQAPVPAGTPAPANNPANEQAAESTDAEDEDRLRCRRQAVTGSRLGRVVCLTDAERRRIEDDSRALVNRAQSQMPLQGN